MVNLEGKKKLRLNLAGPRKQSSLRRYGKPRRFLGLDLSPIYNGPGPYVGALVIRAFFRSFFPSI